MIDLDDLDELFDDLGFDEPTQDQFTEMLSVFTEDFITNAFQIDGRNVKVVTQPSRNREFRGHPETFVHLITRESKFKGKKERQFDRQRANRIHWVKQILIQRADNRIKYYEWTDERGYLKQHYWFEEGDFLVVLKPISADLLVVTGFYVDALEKSKQRKRYNDYRGL